MAKYFAPKRAKIHKKLTPTGEAGKISLYETIEALRKNHGKCGVWVFDVPAAGVAPK
mgnify:CR=1 FL=1